MARVSPTFGRTSPTFVRTSTPDFWEDVYARGGDGWELGRPAPPLVDILDTTPPPRGRVAVPGCGRGHDARLLAARGYDVTGFDFAPAALSQARALAAREGVAATFDGRDVFTLGRELPNATLRGGGWLLACFFPLRALTPGPPFVVSPAEVRRLLAPAFTIERAFDPLRSARGRQGREWVVLARKTGA